MNDVTPLRPAAPRRRNAAATRAAILSAAQTLFARTGYDHVALRDIAGAAGVDVALVNRYFGGKEGLFVEALKRSFRSDRLDEWDRASFPRTAAAMMADNLYADEAADSFQFLLLAATSPTTAPLLNVAMQERFLNPIRDWLGGANAHARARVLAATYTGFLVERLVRGGPLAGAERDAFIDHAAAVFEAAIGRS
ncbi:MAG: TetR family transcriptional regulator [Phenylobacterium sp.]